MTWIRKINWVRTQTATEMNKAWTARRKAMFQDFDQRQSAANSSLTNAWSAQIDGAGTLAGQIALDRVTAEIKAKSAAQAASDNLATDINSSAADIQDSIFSGSSSGQLDSGTQIDLASGTITLSDGTVIDSQTGLKKIDITA